MAEVTVHNSSPSIPDPSALVIKGPSQDGLLYRWKGGDCLSMIAVAYGRPSTDWKVLYQLNYSLYMKRHNTILVGDLIKIPEEWLTKTPYSFDATKISPHNQNYNRESYIKQMFGQLQTYKEQDDA